MNKRGYEFSFAWIFAIFAGAVIIFLAIYGTTRLVQTSRTQIDTVSAKQIGVLLTPTETNLEQSRLSRIIVPQETRLFNTCVLDGNFGVQRLSALVRSGVGSEWQDFPGVESSFRNKYIFSTSEIRAEDEFYVFTKPFNFPYKIADLTIIWPDTKSYCFVFDSQIGSQGEIKRELSDLSPPNIFNVTSLENCPPESTSVCFRDSTGCEVVVQSLQNGGKVLFENGQLIEYVESLDANDKYAMLFAAIFSDKEVYDCQLGRLAKRASNLAELYRVKSNYLTPKGCSSAPVLPTTLLTYKNSLSSGILNSREEALDLQIKNGNLGCKLF